MVRKKHAAKKRTVRRRTTTSRKRGVRRPLRRRYRRKAHTKVGRLWKFIKKQSKGEKGRKDALTVDNPTYGAGNIRGYMGVVAESTYPFRRLSTMRMNLFTNQIGNNNSVRPSFSFSNSNHALVTGTTQGRLGYFTGMILYPFPKKGTNVNEISGNEFFLDSLTFNFMIHKKQSFYEGTAPTIAASQSRGGSLSIYLIIEPTAAATYSSFTADNLYCQLFDNTANYNNFAATPGGTDTASDAFTDGLRRDYFFKKRNLNLSPHVKLVRLLKYDWGVNFNAVTKIDSGEIADGSGTTSTTHNMSYGTYSGNPRVYFYETGHDYQRTHKVNIKIKKRLKVTEQVPNIGKTDALDTAVANQGLATVGNSYNFWILGTTSTFARNANFSPVTVEFNCESIFHDV